MDVRRGNEGGREREIDRRSSNRRRKTRWGEREVETKCHLADSQPV